MTAGARVRLPGTSSAWATEYGSSTSTHYRRCTSVLTASMGEQQEGIDAASAVGELCRGGIEQAAISKPSSLLLTEQQAAISRHAKFQWKKHRAWSFTSSSGSPRGPTTVAQATGGELHAPHASARTGTDRARRSPSTHAARPLGLRGPSSPTGGSLPPFAADSDTAPIPFRPRVEEQ
ncbi:unnamed protein product [Urochloa humidicola]